MKIGILTFHRAYNYGAILQCYSLMKKMQDSFPDCSIEVIDYASSNMMSEYETNSLFKKIHKSMVANDFIISFKLLVKYLMDLPKRSKKKLFVSNRNKSIAKGLDFLSLSSKKLISDDIDSFVKYVESNSYDIIVVGSDAIWNDCQTMVPNFYYLKGIMKSRKFSYAASMHGLKYKLLPEDRIEYVKNALCEFDYIGVRDVETEKYVHYVSKNLKTYHNCDPSIFLDLNKLPVSIESVKEKLVSKGINLNKPIIGLMCEDWLAKKIKEILGDKYQLVSVYEFNKYSDFNLDNLTPFEWAIVFSLFKATFTHFFHGTIFSLKNYTRTFAIEKKSSYSQKYKTKIHDLLDRLGLMECYFVKEEIDKTGWGKIVDILENTDENEEARYRELISNALSTEANTFESFRKAILNIKSSVRNG